MSEVALLLLQLSTSVTLPMAGEILLHPVQQASCKPSPDEITVCAKDLDTYRLPRTSPAYEEGTLLPKAEWRLFGSSQLGVAGVERSVGEFSAPAAMVTVKVPF